MAERALYFEMVIYVGTTMKRLLLFMLTFSLQPGTRFSCCSSAKVVQEPTIKSRVDGLALHKIILLHRRAHTIDYAKFKLNPVDEKRFRAEVAARYLANTEEIKKLEDNLHAAFHPAETHTPMVTKRRQYRRRNVRFQVKPASPTENKISAREV